MEQPLFMRFKAPLTTTLMLLLGCTTTPVDIPAPQAIPQETTQLLVVVTPHWDASQGMLYSLSRQMDEPHSWSSMLPPAHIVVGKNGLGWGRGIMSLSNGHQSTSPQKKEGDMRSPAGLFSLGSAFGAMPQGNTRTAYPYYQTSPHHRCIDDSASRFYNSIRMVSRHEAHSWKTDEPMIHPDGLYDLGIVINHNTQDVKAGAGSCILFHIWRTSSSPTAGCTALSQKNLEVLLSWLNPTAAPLLLQVPATVYTRLSQILRLPSLDVLLLQNQSIAPRSTDDQQAQPAVLDQSALTPRSQQR